MSADPDLIKCPGKFGRGDPLLGPPACPYPSISSSVSGLSRLAMASTTPSTSAAIATTASASRSEDPVKKSTDAQDPPNKLAEFLAVGSSSPWPAWSMSALLMASLPTSSRFSGALYPIGLAPTWQVTPLAMVFGLSGYITSAGDYYNGSGTASAWSVIYLFLHGRDSWRHTFARPPKTKLSLFPISLSAFALTNGIIHGYVYWSGFYRDQLKEELERTKKSS
ncbi:hypothetical protein PtA15_1A882 [Puccinia triticina]|uniref:Mitochondrial pyruvate carrier n=1 Tax=Puccinia triticina TaxID=208348 RepID=A0ABY7C9R8_9BASI|nr:uncharacterized protein PtA15_1A882 [Puccinia triticina]WAQ81540.1 hypothetical protein PtA15_1A882 [Puccinia triticina]